MKFDIPIVLIVYNRPKHVKRLLKIVAKIKPKNLVIISDGPKKNLKDQLKCKEVNYIIKKISWKCSKTYITSKTNMGLKDRIYTGLSVFFKKYKKGIILEDDCMPDKSFFYYCKKMLKKYEHEKKISTISGCKFNKLDIKNSYYFSKYSCIWGWATWRRSWKEFDINIKFWPKYKISKKWKFYCRDTVERNFWNKIFDKLYQGQINSWAYAYLLNNFYLNRLTIVPKYNLIKNIGFGKESTNTKYYNKKFVPKSKTFEKTIKTPKIIRQYVDADKKDFSDVYAGGRRNKYPLRFFYMIYLNIIKYLIK